jgi:acyl dehydratase
MVALDDLVARVGQEAGVSDWIEVSQPMIDRFAEATGDHQFIHVDPKRAAETMFGGTIAHGFLVLSLLSRMSYDALPRIEGAAISVNYGSNRVRFVSPVRAGRRVRGRFVLRDVSRKAEDRVLVTYDVTVEIDGEEKPALVAEWLTMTMLAAAT